MKDKIDHFSIILIDIIKRLEGQREILIEKRFNRSSSLSIYLILLLPILPTMGILFEGYELIASGVIFLGVIIYSILLYKYSKNSNNVIDSNIYYLIQKHYDLLDELMAIKSLHELLLFLEKITQFFDYIKMSIFRKEIIASEVNFIYLMLKYASLELRRIMDQKIELLKDTKKEFSGTMDNAQFESYLKLHSTRLDMQINKFEELQKILVKM